jgi:hypothetical protein
MLKLNPTIPESNYEEGWPLESITHVEYVTIISTPLEDSLC